jgi:hypothetical protein
MIDLEQIGGVLRRPLYHSFSTSMNVDHGVSQPMESLCLFVVLCLDVSQMTKTTKQNNYIVSWATKVSDRPAIYGIYT